MLVKLEIHSLAAEDDALHPQKEALFGSGFKAQLDLSPRTHHSLPREPVGRFRLKEARDSAMVLRVAGRCRNLAICGDFPLRNGMDDPSKGRVTNFVGPRNEPRFTMG
jgi:hypothetical protein